MEYLAIDRHTTLLLALATLRLPYSWKTRKNHSGIVDEGIFIVGIVTPTGVSMYHCHNEFWSLFKIPVIPKAPTIDNEITLSDTAIVDYLNTADTRLINKHNIQQIEKIVQDYIIPIFDETNDGLISRAAFIGFYNR